MSWIRDSQLILDGFIHISKHCPLQVFSVQFPTLLCRTCTIVLILASGCNTMWSIIIGIIKTNIYSYMLTWCFNQDCLGKRIFLGFLHCWLLALACRFHASLIVTWVSLWHTSFTDFLIEMTPWQTKGADCLSCSHERIPTGWGP